MGGGVSIPMPVSAARQEDLKAKYAKFLEDGVSEEDMNAKLTKAMPGLIVFDQIDCDHTGKVDARELKRALRALPRKKPTPPEGGWPDGKMPDFVPFEQLYETLDSDGDGEISLDEWLENLGKLPGLENAINNAIDPATGKIRGYVSLEERLAELVGKGDAATDEEKAKIEAIRASIGSAGVIVFRQLDLDGSGKLSRVELLRVLKKVFPSDDKELNVDELLAILDVDGDGIIDEDEWIAQIDKTPKLKEAINKVVDTATGKIIGYAGLDEQLATVQATIKDLEAKGEDVTAAKEEETKLLAKPYFAEKAKAEAAAPAAEEAAAAPAAAEEAAPAAAPAEEAASS